MSEPITADCLAEIDGIRHGFFTRGGGVSTGIYGSLNCGLGSKDDAALVSQNRERIAAGLGKPGAAVITPFQIHSSAAVIAERAWTRATMPKADAIVTRTPGLVIGVLTADCTPVLFADAEAKVVGAAHAGWRGALSGILASTVAAMERIGARRSRIIAAVGPCITQPAYEVGAEFEAQFVAASPENAKFFKTYAAGGAAAFRPAGLRCEPPRSAGDRQHRDAAPVHLPERIAPVQLSPRNAQARSRLWPPNLCHCCGLATSNAHKCHFRAWRR